MSLKLCIRSCSEKKSTLGFEETKAQHRKKKSRSPVGKEQISVGRKVRPRVVPSTKLRRTTLRYTAIKVIVDSIRKVSKSTRISMYNANKQWQLARTPSSST
jgi:hypothetical protein